MNELRRSRLCRRTIVEAPVPIWRRFAPADTDSVGEDRAGANEAGPPAHQSVKNGGAIRPSIDDLPQYINLFFMLLFKPILDRDIVVSRVGRGKQGLVRYKTN